MSFEDVLEELVGDIRDEFDIEKGPFFERSKNAVVVDAELPLRDLATETGWPIAAETNETIEKWALRQWGGKVPHTGAQLIVGAYTLTATEVGPRRIRRLRIVHDPAPVTPDAESDGSAPEM